MKHGAHRERGRGGEASWGRGPRWEWGASAGMHQGKGGGGLLQAERTEAQRPDGKRAGVPGNVGWLEKTLQGGGLAPAELSWGQVRKTPLWETGALFWGPWGKPLLCFMQKHEASILWPPDVKNWLTGKDPDAGKDWRQQETGTTEDEMVGWHHWLSGHEFEQTLGVGEGQGSLACCSPRGCKESDTTEWLNNEGMRCRLWKITLVAMGKTDHSAARPVQERQVKSTYLVFREASSECYEDFPGGPMVKNSPSNAGDIGLISGPGRSHMLQGS